MADDIVPGLLRNIERDFNKSLQNNPTLTDALIRLRSGKATYNDANTYARSIGEMLTKAFKKNIRADTLPDGRMYYNIARRILDPTLTGTHDLVSTYSLQVQEIINANERIGLASLPAKLNPDKIDGIVNRIASEESWEDISWILGDPVITFANSVVDEMVERNAEFQAEAGITATIIRRTHGKCCEWCTNLAGTYTYPDTPREVFFRHNNCDCLVDYKPIKNKRWKQDVWSKDWHL